MSWRGTYGGMVALALALGAACAPAGALAQNSPDTFTLPEAKPSPTPAPQGPADELSGVPIAPRLIDPRRTRPAPREETAPAPRPAPAPSAPPSAAPDAAPIRPLDEAFNEVFSRGKPPPLQGLRAGTPASAAGASPGARAPSRPRAEAGAATPSQALGLEARLPGTPATPAPSDGEYAVGPGEWVDVAPAGSADLTAPPRPRSDTLRKVPLAANAYSLSLWAAAALGLLLFVWIVGRALRARREDAVENGQELTSGARKELESAYDVGAGQSEPRPPEGLQMDVLKESLAEAMREPMGEPATTPAQEPLKPTAPVAMPAKAVTQNAASPRAQPPRLALSLFIISARRSVMMFTIEYRLTLANRSDSPARDLVVTGRLACAKSESNTAARPALDEALDQVLGRVDRIGPQQSHTLTGALELPIADIAMMRQGSAFVFVPLMNVFVQSPGAQSNSAQSNGAQSDGPTTRATRFIIGTPSAQSQTRVHPITMDARIGGIAGLRALRIKPAPSTGSLPNSAS